MKKEMVEMKGETKKEIYDRKHPEYQDAFDNGKSEARRNIIGYLNEQIEELIKIRNSTGIGIREEMLTQKIELLQQIRNWILERGDQ